MGKSSTSFKPKKSGNPGGAPKKGHSLREAFIDYFSKHRPGEPKGVTRILKVIQTLEKNAIEKEDTPAAKYIADQIYGKAKETVDANITGNMQVEVIDYSSQVHER